MSVAPDVGRRRLSFDELLDEIHRTAQDADAGPDRFRAAKLLLSFKSAAVILPEPVNEAEFIDYLSRVMKPAGRALCQLAYQKSFNNSRVERDSPTRIYDVPEVKEGHLSEEEKQFARRITSRRLLHNHFPELKNLKGGSIKGMPVGKGEAVLRAWLYRTAVQAMVYRKQLEAAVKPEGTEADGEVQAQETDS